MKCVTKRFRFSFKKACQFYFKCNVILILVLVLVIRISLLMCEIIIKNHFFSVHVTTFELSVQCAEPHGVL